EARDETPEDGGIEQGRELAKATDLPRERPEEEARDPDREVAEGVPGIGDVGAWGEAARTLNGAARSDRVEVGEVRSRCELVTGIPHSEGRDRDDGERQARAHADPGGDVPPAHDESHHEAGGENIRHVGAEP